jgi:exopolyphosphatase
LLSPEKTRWLLVDHNSLQGELGRVYGDRVVGCIDHHDEENKVPKDCGPEPRIVEKAGSCASLIVNHCKEAWDKLTHDDEAVNYDSAWVRIALAPVLIDTANLKNKNKVTKHDISAAETLEKILRSSSSDKYDRDGYYTEINDAKEAIDDLSLNDILRKDYKQWTEGQGVNLGMSSAIKDINFLLDKVKNENSFWKEVHAFAEARKLSVCAVMTSFSHNGQYGREILLLGLDEAGVKAVKTFEGNASEELGLQGWESGRLDSTDSKTQWRRCWVQKNLGMSRKQVGPLLRKSII